MKKTISAIFDIIGEILAVILVIVYALLIINANFPFIPEGWLLNIMLIARTYGSLLLVGIVGMEAFSRLYLLLSLH